MTLTDLITVDTAHSVLSLSHLPDTVNALGPAFLEPANIINWLISILGPLAIIGVCLIVFVETGLLAFFLPGDSLLFTVGMLVATDVLKMPIWLVCLLIFLSAFGGDQLGYFLGNKYGPSVFNRTKKSRLFKPEYLDKTNEYFEKYGGRTIILARFVPIVRTFAPVAAGVGSMNYKTFVTYNFIGALLWGVGVTLLGFWLGQFEFVQKYIEYILIGIVLISVIPVLLQLWQQRKEAAKKPAAEK